MRDKCLLLIFEAKAEFTHVKSVNLKLLMTCFDALRLCLVNARRKKKNNEGYTWPYMCMGTCMCLLAWFVASCVSSTQFLIIILKWIPDNLSVITSPFRRLFSRNAGGEFRLVLPFSYSRAIVPSLMAF